MKRSAWMVAALVMSAGMAFGQATTTEKTTKAAEPVLKGPEVKDNSLPGTKGQFGPDGAKGKEVRGMQGPNPMLFRQAVMSLKNKETPEELRLTPTQEDSISLITDDAQRTNVEYRTKHMDEVRELMKDLPPQERQKAEMLLRARGAGGPGGPGGPQGRQGRPAGPDGAPADGPQGRQGRPQRGPEGGKPEGFRPEGPVNDEMMPPPKDGEKAAKPGEALTPEQVKEREAKAEKAKARLKEIMESAPKPQDAQSRMYAILSDGQKTLVDKRLAEMTTKQQQQQANRRGGQGKPGEAGAKRPGGKRGGANGEAGPDGQQAPANAQREARRAEMREKMQNMTPEERKAFIEDMRAKREARRGQGKPGGAKPAPDKDSLTPPAP